MWRGVVFLVIIALAGVSLADVQYGDASRAIQSTQRLKRSPSPYYNPDCPPDYYHHHPHPPFWPPPPPPPPPPPYWPPPPPPPRPEVIYVQERGDNQAYTQPENEPCTTCQSSGASGSSAVSNAQSETGQAIAVAIAKAKSNK